MKCNVDQLSLFVRRSVHIPEGLDARIGVHLDIPLVELAEGLDLLGSAPDAVLAGPGHHGIEGLFLLLGRRGGAHGSRCPGGGRSSPSGGTPPPADRGGEIDKVIAMRFHVLGQVTADLRRAVPHAVQLVRQGVVETVA